MHFFQSLFDRPASKPKSISSLDQNKENINFSNFSQQALRSYESKRSHTISTISILSKKPQNVIFHTSATTSMNYEPRFTSHTRVKSIAKLPYLLPQMSSMKKNRFMPQNLAKKSISIPQKKGDLADIPEVISPDKDSVIKIESESKSQISFPDEINNSERKKIMFFNDIVNRNIKKMTSPKLQPTVLRKPATITTVKNIKNSEKSVIKPCKTKIFEVFTAEKHEIAIVNDDIAQFFILNEINYELDPHFIRKCSEITANMRMILFDWMLEVASEFSIKRHTVQMALFFVDKYLEKNYDAGKDLLQLIGVAGLLISSKIEEVEPPKLTQFRKACDDGFSIKQIQEMEIEIMKTLNFKLNPPTIQNWTEITLSQWDFFIENQDQDYSNKFYIYFRKSDSESFKNYSQFCQIVDCALLDISTLQYKVRTLVAGLLYLKIGIYSETFEKEKVCREFSKTSRFLFEYEDLNSVFAEFLNKFMQLTMVEIFPTIQFWSEFFSVELNEVFFKEEWKKISYEEILALQNYQGFALEFIRNRRRK